MRNRFKIAVLGLAALLLGAVLYILFRPASFITVSIGAYSWLSQLRIWLQPFDCSLLRFYLPDMLWAFALSCGLQTILAPQKWGIVSCGVTAFVCGAIWELLQWLGAVRGTGDWLDILMYFLAALASIFVNKRRK